MLILLFGPGKLALDRVLDKVIRKKYPANANPAAS
jgi:hypothetical protein